MLFDGSSGRHNGHDAAELAEAMMRKPEPPKTDDAVERFPVFADAVRRRLAMGARHYASEPATEKPLSMLIDEITTELEDAAGWSCLLWQRLQALKAKLEAVEKVETP